MSASTLFNVIFAWKCSSTHHKLALDALNQQQGPAAANWRDLCLANVGSYLQGAKAPDDQFKDFRNHVLHVRDGLWGGAITSTGMWYNETVSALKAQDWKAAVYNAGILSHYYSDPLMPFHTGQSEAEGIVHRAAEWSVACAYRELTELLESQLGGWPDVPVPGGRNWLESMVIAGARAANPHYEFSIDHYDIQQGVKNPPQGLDQPLRECLARLLGHAVVGFARIMERAILEAGVEIPDSNLSMQSVLTQLTIPISWVTKKLKDARERAVVEAMYAEFTTTGKVLKTLPEDEATVRKAHATGVLRKPLAELDREKPRAVGTAHQAATPLTVPRESETRAKPHERNEGLPKVAVQPESLPPVPARPTVELPEQSPALPPTPTDPPTVKFARNDTPQPIPKPHFPVSAPAKFYLTPEMPIEKAPAIGPKTAKQLERCGVTTVATLLDVQPEQLATELGDRRYDADTIAAWQHQARLCCTVPQLRGHDAQFLVACDICTADELSRANPAELFQKVDAYVATPAGERILRGGERPDLNEVSDWIARAAQGNQTRAA